MCSSAQFSSVSSQLHGLPGVRGWCKGHWPGYILLQSRQNWMSWLAARNIMQVKLDFLSERIQARNSVEKLCIYLVVRLSSQLHVSVAVINLISFHLPSWLEWNCPTWCDWWRLASNVFPSQVSQPQWGWQWHRYQGIRLARAVAGNDKVGLEMENWVTGVLCSL